MAWRKGVNCTYCLVCCMGLCLSFFKKNSVYSEPCFLYVFRKLWEGFAGMDLICFHFSSFPSLRYPLPFLIFGLLFIRDGLLFSGFRAEKFPSWKFAFVITIILLIVGAGTKEESPDIRDSGRAEVKETLELKSVCGIELRRTSWGFYLFPFILVAMEH